MIEAIVRRDPKGVPRIVIRLIKSVQMLSGPADMCMGTDELLLAEARKLQAQIDAACREVEKQQRPAPRRIGSY